MNAIKTGLFLGYVRNGETVTLQFENAEIVVSRCGAIALAYCLSELVE